MGLLDPSPKPLKGPVPSPQKPPGGGRGFICSGVVGGGLRDGVGPRSPSWGQRECPVSMGERREEALNTTSCACARLVLLGQKPE